MPQPTMSGKSGTVKTVTFTPMTVKDAQGNVVAAPITTTLVSSDNEKVLVANNGDGTWTVDFQSAGSTTLVATHNVVGTGVSKAVSRLVVVSVGDPAEIEGGDILIDGQ